MLVLIIVFWVSLIFTFQVGMEFWARWAHRALWHASLWSMHQVGDKILVYYFQMEYNSMIQSLHDS